jgi:hypothetical protein
MVIGGQPMGLPREKRRLESSISMLRRRVKHGWSPELNVPDLVFFKAGSSPFLCSNFIRRIKRTSAGSFFLDPRTPASLLSLQ